MVESTLTLFYVLGHGGEGAFVLGTLVLPRAGVLATARLLQRHLLAAGAEAAAAAAAAAAAPPPAKGGKGAPPPEEPKPPPKLDWLIECTDAVKELLQPPATAPPEETPPPADDEEDAEPPPPPVDYAAAVGPGALEALATLFDPLTGGTMTDPAVCAWLASLLVSKK